MPRRIGPCDDRREEADFVTPGDIAAIVSAVVALLVLLGGYVGFVLGRTVMGQVEFDVELMNHHRGPKQLIAEIACVLRNLGPNMVIVTNVQLRARYRHRHVLDGSSPSRARTA
jgi:hypothetical protein